MIFSFAFILCVVDTLCMGERDFFTWMKKHFIAGSSSETAAAAARTLAARKRLAAARAAMKKDNESSVTFDAGFFNVGFYSL